MVALPDADGQDFLRNKRPTIYRVGLVLERVCDVQIAKGEICTSYGVFWLEIKTDGCVYAHPGESMILCTVIIGRRLHLCRGSGLNLRCGRRLDWD